MMSADFMPTYTDPRMEKLESWMANLHSSIFDTTMHAQSIVTHAQKTLRDVETDNEDFQQLKRDFEIATSIYKGKHTHIDSLIAATESMESHQDIPRLHIAQCYAAGTCVITLQRMFDAIPDDLQNDDTITGSLVEKSNGHLTMWRHLTTPVPR
jgi:hypothetical protein